MRRDRLSSTAAVDLGTSRIRAWHPGRGPVLDEPSLVALDEYQGCACALGTSARNMIGRIPEGVTIRRAVEAGKVTDFEAARMLARHALDRTPRSWLARRPFVVTAVPVDCSGMQIRTLEQALLQVGAARVVVVPAPVAAAVGGALPPAQGADTTTADGRVGHGTTADSLVGDGMVVDVGAGTADLAVFARGRMVDAMSVPTGGDLLDQAVAALVRREHQLALGPVAAEELRIGGCAGDGAAGATPLQTRGRHLGNGTNQVAYVDVDEVRQVCRPVLAGLADAIRRMLARCPAELRAEITEQGVALTGGLARSAWTCDRLQAEAGVRLRVAHAPDTRTAEGLARLALSPERAVELAVRS